jgi:hypothetical protein
VDIPEDNSDADKSDNNSGQNGEGEAQQPAAGQSAAAPAASQLPVANQAPSAGAASDATNDLPVVEAPSLDGALAEASAAEPDAGPAPPAAARPMLAIASDGIRGRPDQTAALEFAAAPRPRSFRFALLAAIIALIAGGGAFVGTLAASNVARHEVAAAQAPRAAQPHGVPQELKTALAELSALKASLDAVNRGTTAQFGKIADRLASLERLQADQRAAAPEITGSIAKPAEPPPAAAPTPAATAHVLNDWIVRDVRNGRALIESRYGGLFVVGSGGSLPGLGRVESVRRQDGAWIVVTAKGTITSDR